MRNALKVIGLLTGVSAGTALADTSATVQAILGRTLENTHVKDAHIYADGTLDGVYNGISYAGNWSLDSGRFCRELTRGLEGEHACLDLSPILDPSGKLIAVNFHAQGIVTRFDLR